MVDSDSLEEPESASPQNQETLTERKKIPRKDPHVWEETSIAPGTGAAVHLHVSESFSGLTIPIPVYVKRGASDGPVVFVTAAIHGDEINGTGAIRQLITDPLMELRSGTLIFVPVVNITGFDRHSRYLPDGRDLNRCFPGSRRGSLASRMARIFFREIVGRCDFGIDLHTASIRRTNFPNVRANMNDPAVAHLAEAFGCELIVHGAGPEGAFRREACNAGCPTIVLEAGEIWKVEPAVVQHAVQGVRNVLSRWGMIDATPLNPSWQLVIRKSSWVRAEKGGFLQFHVAPGDLVKAGDPLATNSSLTGMERNRLDCPFDGVVLGMTTLPAISPGDPVCHLARISADEFEAVASARLASPASLEVRLYDQLATNVMVVPAGRDSGKRNEATESTGNSP